MLLYVCLFMIWVRVIVCMSVHVIVCMSVHDMGSCYCVYVCSCYEFMLLWVCLFIIWVRVIECMSVHNMRSCYCV